MTHPRKGLFCCFSLIAFALSPFIASFPLFAQTPGDQARGIIDRTVQGVSSDDLEFLLGPQHAEELSTSLQNLKNNLDRAESEAIQRFVEAHSEADRVGLSEQQARELHDAYDMLSSILGISDSVEELLGDHALGSVKAQIFNWAVDFTYTQYNRLERQYVDELETAEALLGQDRRGTYDSALGSSDTMKFEFQRVGGEIRDLNVVCDSPRPEIGIDVVNPTPYGPPRVVVASKAYNEQDVSRLGFVIMENNLGRNYGRVLFMQMEDGAFVDTSADQIASYQIDKSLYDSIASARDLMLRVGIEWGNGAKSACLVRTTDGGSSPKRIGTEEMNCSIQNKNSSDRKLTCYSPISWEEDHVINVYKPNELDIDWETNLSGYKARVDNVRHLTVYRIKYKEENLLISITGDTESINKKFVERVNVPEFANYFLEAK
jgi:hypothetical protein